MADRPGDVGNIQGRGRSLVEQGLEAVMILGVEEKDVDLGAVQGASRREPAEAAAHDHDPGTAARFRPVRSRGFDPQAFHHLVQKAQAMTATTIAAIRCSRASCRSLMSSIFRFHTEPERPTPEAVPEAGAVLLAPARRLVKPLRRGQ